MSLSIVEACDKCFGQETCGECPRYMDDCDGKEEVELSVIEEAVKRMPIKNTSWKAKEEQK